MRSKVNELLHAPGASQQQPSDARWSPAGQGSQAQGGRGQGSQQFRAPEDRRPGPVPGLGYERQNVSTPQGAWPAPRTFSQDSAGRGRGSPSQQQTQQPPGGRGQTSPHGQTASSQQISVGRGRGSQQPKSSSSQGGDSLQKPGWDKQGSAKSTHQVFKLFNNDP